MSFSGDEPLPTGKITYLSFNRDGTSLSVGTTEACRHFSLDTEHPEQLEYGTKIATKIVSRLGRTSIVAVVSFHNVRMVRVMTQNTEICSYRYKNSCLSVRLTRKKMIVCLEETIHIHDMNSLNVTKSINILPNPRGIITTSDGENDRLLMAYPVSEKNGGIHIFDVQSYQTERIINAFDQPLALIQFNGQGTLIAAASVEGTYIRVFNPRDGSCLRNFYRGLSSVEIYSINFSQDDEFLAISSSNPTIHIFKMNTLENEGESCSPTTKNATVLAHGTNSSKIAGSELQRFNQKQQGTNYDTSSSYYSLNAWIGWASATIVPVLSTAFAETISGSANRAFAIVRLPFKDTKSIVVLSNSYTENGIEGRVIVAAHDGYLYVYQMDKEGPAGRDCQLLKQVQLVKDA